MKTKGSFLKDKIIKCFEENNDLTAIEISKIVNCSPQFTREILNKIPLYLEKKAERDSAFKCSVKQAKAIKKIEDYNATIPVEFQSTHEEIVAFVRQFDKRACLNSYGKFIHKKICEFVLANYKLNDVQVAEIMHVSSDHVYRARDEEGIPTLQERFESCDYDLIDDEKFHSLSTATPDQYKDYVNRLVEDGYEPPCIPLECWDRFFEISSRKRAWECEE